ncbi:hypothetical protein RUND412_009073 [Rhizina undulata]
MMYQNACQTSSDKFTLIPEIEDLWQRAPTLRRPLRITQKRGQGQQEEPSPYAEPGQKVIKKSTEGVAADNIMVVDGGCGCGLMMVVVDAG